jgi:hypothetical protein
MSNYTKTVYTVVTLTLMVVGYIIARVVELDYSKGDQFKVSDYLAILVAMSTFIYSYLGLSKRFCNEETALATSIINTN